MSRYLIIEYSKVSNDTRCVSLQVVVESEMFDAIQEEGEKPLDQRKKISIYKLTDCVIDWS